MTYLQSLSDRDVAIHALQLSVEQAALMTEIITKYNDDASIVQLANWCDLCITDERCPDEICLLMTVGLQAIGLWIANGIVKERLAARKSAADAVDSE